MGGRDGYILMPKSAIITLVLVYLSTVALAGMMGYVVGRDDVAQESMEYIYQTCTGEN